MVKDSLKLYSCRLCNSSFLSKVYLQRHQAVHSNERNFHCLVCAKSYKYRKGLNRHIKNSHSELDPSACFFSSKPLKPFLDLSQSPARDSEYDISHVFSHDSYSFNDEQFFQVYSTCPFP